MKFLNDLKFQKQLLQRNSSCLKKGKYILHENMRTYLLKDRSKKNTLFPQGDHGLANLIKIWIARFFFSVKIYSDGREFGAQAVYFSNLPDSFNRDAKFFDYESEQVHTICPNRKRYDLYLRNRLYFEKYFNMPDLLSKNDIKLTYEERLIPKQKIMSSEWESIFHCLFDNYTKYYQTIGVDVQEQVCNLSKELSVLGIDSVPQTTDWYRQHGDLSADNFIYGKGGRVYFIDFDHANYYPLFYDILFLMVNLYIVEENQIGVKLFLDGNFDRYFESFSADSKLSKYECFVLYVECFWRMRVGNFASEDKKKVYLDLFQDMLDSLRR